MGEEQMRGEREEKGEEDGGEEGGGDEERRRGGEKERGDERRKEDELEGEEEEGEGEEEESVLPAELAGHALQELAGDLADVRADIARPGKGHEVDAGVGDERVAERAARTEDQVEHAFRQAGLFHDLDQAHGQHRGEGRRLEDHGVPQDERRHDLPGRDREREVPRGDRGHDPERVPHAHRPLVRQLGRDDGT